MALNSPYHSSPAVSENNLTSDLDVNPIEELDPSVSGGYHVLFDREIPIELRSQSAPSQAGAQEAIKVKVLLAPEGQSGLRIELTSESDLFFLYHHNLDEVSFRALQEQQRLMVELQEFPQVILRQLNQVLKEPHSHLAVMFLASDGTARLDFIQSLEYKYVELLSLTFTAATESVVRQCITFRYNSLKSRLALTNNRLAEINSLIKVKNPSLLLQLQRSGPSALNQTRKSSQSK
ncbi:hypothetical protein P9112_012317 [Eukaryota sp. TZLM1-RC]